MAHLLDTADAPATTPVWEIHLPTPGHRIPGVQLAGFVDRSPGPFVLRSVPHPAITLVLDLGPGRLAVEDRAGTTHRGSAVAGFAGSLTARGTAIECILVRLSPLVAWTVLGSPVAHVVDRVVAPADLWGNSATRLVQRLRDTSSWPERFALAERWLRGRCGVGPRLQPEVAWAWERIIGSRGTARVDDVAHTVGWSRQRLWSRFRSQLGQPPKALARLVRFDHAAHLLHAGTDPATAAAVSGYVDQPHLHRDVVAFSGTTPARVGSEPWLSVDRTAWV